MFPLYHKRSTTTAAHGRHYSACKTATWQWTCKEENSITLGPFLPSFTAAFWRCTPTNGWQGFWTLKCKQNTQDAAYYFVGPCRQLRRTWPFCLQILQSVVASPNVSYLKERQDVLQNWGYVTSSLCITHDKCRLAAVFSDLGCACSLRGVWQRNTSVKILMAPSRLWKANAVNSSFWFTSVMYGPCDWPPHIVSHLMWRRHVIHLWGKGGQLHA
jgi:hypothetical protein